MMNPFGLPALVPGAAANPFANPAALMSVLDPKEIEKRIGELRVVENWLAMNINLIQMTIKTLEWQKASLEGLHAGAEAAKVAAEKAAREAAEVLARESPSMGSAKPSVTPAQPAKRAAATPSKRPPVGKTRKGTD